MRNAVILFLLLNSSFLIPNSSFAADSSASFLPTEPLFKPLLADPREPRAALSRTLGQRQWEGAIGRTIEIAQWGEGVRKAWGITGSAFAWLDQRGTSFPLRDSDWWFGTYLSRKAGVVAQRLEYTHVSSHLGDALAGARERIVYSREMVRLLLSAERRTGRRFHLGAGYWVKTIPREEPWVFQVGMTQTLRLGPALGRELSLVAGYDLKYKQEADGALNSSVVAGLRLHDADEATRGILMNVGFRDGHHEFGQFFRERDRRWMAGLAFE
jgi:hypothetical protein